MEIVDPEPRKCKCGKWGYLVIDPYQEDVNGLRVEVVMCDDCHFEACQDI